MNRPLPTLLLAAVLAHAAQAQVAVDQGALDSLKPAAPAVPATKPKPVPRPRATKPKPSASTNKPAVTKPAPRAAPAPQAPVAIAPAPPPAAALVAPPLPPPRPAPEIDIPVSADAKGTASKIIGGLRITFGPGAADLNPTTVAALRSIARTIGADPAATFNVIAYAEGTADDPSTPRRLSLSRALAARAVLMSEGIASTRIYPRALGATPSDGPADRVDVTQVGIAPAPS